MLVAFGAIFTHANQHQGRTHYRTRHNRRCLSRRERKNGYAQNRSSRWRERRPRLLLRFLINIRWGRSPRRWLAFQEEEWKLDKDEDCERFIPVSPAEGERHKGDHRNSEAVLRRIPAMCPSSVFESSG